MSQKSQNPRILVLGASGQIGQMVCALAPAGVDLVPVVRQGGNGLVWQPGHRLPDLRADVVLALWGVVRGDDAALCVNKTLALQAQQLSAAVGADRVLHCSSAAVYPPSDTPLSEDIVPDPPNAYGRAKRDMEQALRDADGPRAVVLRIGNVAGAESLFKAGRGNGNVTLDRFADGQGPRRSYIAPSDLVSVLLGLARLPLETLPDCLNIAAPAPVAMADLALAMGWSVSFRPAASSAVPLVHLDTTRLQRLLPLATPTAQADHIAADVQRGGWHL